MSSLHGPDIQEIDGKATCDRCLHDYADHAFGTFDSWCEAESVDSDLRRCQCAGFLLGPVVPE